MFFCSRWIYSFLYNLSDCLTRQLIHFLTFSTLATSDSPTGLTTISDSSPRRTSNSLASLALMFHVAIGMLKLDSSCAGNSLGELALRHSLYHRR